MSQSQLSKLRSHRECLVLVADLVAGTQAAQEAALAILRREVGDYVECFAALPFDWLDDTEHARRAIAERVLARLEADRYRVLRDWRCRALRHKDHARFWTMVRTVLWYVAIEYGGPAPPDFG
jgi:hypothetical protein